ncbi:sulfotransferase domain-containing protein [archaeon]|nr:sulfotransferase domain-containing protein [archaeon]
MLNEQGFILESLYRDNIRVFDAVNFLRRFDDGLRGADLCIDGYPRSANSYAVNLAGNFNPSLRIVHHIHSQVIIRKAVKHGIPTIVLIRNPRDAIVSEYIRMKYSTNKEPSIDYLIQKYIDYYNTVSDVLSSVSLVPFSEITNNPVSFIELVSRLTDTVTKRNYKELVAEIMSQSKAKVTKEIIYTTSVPTKERTLYKKEVSEELTDLYDFSDAEKLYHMVLNRTNNTEP